MEINDRIFNNGRTTNLLLKFSVPSIISLLVAELYNTVNTVFAGRYIGPEAIAALNVAFPIQRLLSSLSLLIAVGAATFVSRSLGEKNPFAIRKTIINSFVISFAFMIIIPLSIFIFKRSLLYKMGASIITYPLADQYIAIILLGGIFQCLGIVGCYIMTALGNTRMTLYSNLIGAVLNVILNYALVAHCAIGIKGSAISTVISQIASFIYQFYNFRSVIKQYKIKLNINSIAAGLNSKIIRNIIKIGFSTFIIEISDAVVAVVLNNILLSKGGDAAVIVVGVVTRISMFMFITIIGISAAMQPIVAFNFGAKRFNKVKETVLVSIKAVTISSIAVAAILNLFSGKIIGFFLKDKEILPVAVKSLRICISILPLVGVYYIGIYYYQAIGEAKRSLLLSIFRQLVVFIPAAIILVQILGTIGAWIAYPVSDGISVIFALALLRNGNKKKKKGTVYTEFISDMERKLS